jgi:membrane associated rhomboid family serine protease
VSASALRDAFARDVISQLWQAARNATTGGDVACPSCSRAMRSVPLTADSGAPLVDVCAVCTLIWFDEGELRHLPPLPPSEPAVGFSSRAREAAAMMEVELRRQDFELRQASEPPDERWKQVLAVLGVPVVADAEYEPRRPWSTLALAAVLAIAWWLQRGELADVVAAHAFLPSDPWRAHGATLVTYAFIHADAVHLAANVLFLWSLGSEVEAFLGRVRYLALLAAAAIAGALGHAWLAANPNQPLLGASAAVSGTIACFAVAYPRARVVTTTFGWRWLRISAMWWLAAWILGQLCLSLADSHSLALGAHLGGAAVGVAAGIALRRARR